MGYDPTQGRWTEADPLGYPDGANRYQFCLDSPVMLLDPFGLQTCGELRDEIIRLGRLLENKVSKYDPIEDGKGGHPYAGPGGTTKYTQPGTHFRTIVQRQGRLRELIEKYDEQGCNCPDPDDNGGNKIPKALRDMVYTKYPQPVYPSSPWWAGGGRTATNAIQYTSVGLGVLGGVLVIVGTGGGALGIIGGTGGAAGGGGGVAGTIGGAAVSAAAAAAAPAPPSTPNANNDSDDDK